MSTNERIEKWDILKLILIFFVVLGHAADFYTGESEQMRSLYLFLYTFHMPLFLFISGLFGKRTVDELPMQKLTGFLVIYVAMKLLGWLNNTAVFDLNLLSEHGIPWYMWVMFFYPLITYLLRNVKAQYVLVGSVLFAMIAGFDHNIGDFLMLSRMIIFFPFYYLGYVLEPDKVAGFTKKFRIKIVAVVCIVVVAIIVFTKCDEIYNLRYLFTATNSYKTIWGEPKAKGFFLRLLCYVISTLMGISVMALVPERLPVKWVSKLGQRSLSVYFYHLTVLNILYGRLNIRGIFARLPGGDSGYWIIPLSVLLVLVFSMKIFDAPVRFLMKLPTMATKKKSD